MANKTEFVVMTINAGGGRRARGAQLNPEEIAGDLYQLIMTTIGSPGSAIGMPDVIAVQESHQVLRPGENSPVETTQKLARLLGGRYRSFFSKYLDSYSHAHPNKWREDGPFARFERVKQGNAVITNKTLSEWPWGLPPEGCPGYGKLAPISTQISGATLYSTGNRDTEPRYLIVVPLSLGQGVSLYFMATHLTTLTREDRRDRENRRSQEASKVRSAQVHEILRIVDELRRAEENQEPKTPIILAGDFNARPGSPELDALEQTFVRPNPHWCDGADYQGEPWTHVRYQIHIDHIFYNDPSGLLTLIDCCILGLGQVEEVTDHFPVIAKFEISAPAPKVEGEK